MKYGILQVNQANLDYDHLYLASIYGMFPTDSIGGSSRTERASRLLNVSYGLGASVKTDIAGDKKIFRSRAWIRDFFEIHQIKPGDEVVIECVGKYCFHVYPLRGLRT